MSGGWSFLSVTKGDLHNAVSAAEHRVQERIDVLQIELNEAFARIDVLRSFWRPGTATPEADLLASLQEMVAAYGSDDGDGPIPIIERARAAIRKATD